MGVTTERLPRSLVSLEIEVDEDRLEASMDKAVRRLSQRVRIPGFRPGKAPRHILERTLGKPALMQEALEDLLPDIYSETIASESIDAIGQPSFELKSTEPLVVAATVPVRPTIDLKDYKSLRAPRPEVDGSPDQVEASLTNLRRRYATLDPVDRAVQWGDTVRADVTVSVEQPRALGTAGAIAQLAPWLAEPTPCRSARLTSFPALSMLSETCLAAGPSTLAATSRRPVRFSAAFRTSTAGPI